MKTFVQKCLATALTLLVLLTTVSLTVEKHFCGDTLIDVAVFTTPLKCGIEGSETALNIPVLKKSCCKDVIEVISSQNQLDVNTKNVFTKFQKQFAAVFIYSYANIFEDTLFTQNTYLHYDQPLLVYDITVLQEVFLI